MTNTQFLESLLNSLYRGDLTFLNNTDTIAYINDNALYIIQKYKISYLETEDFINAKILLEISNILYNNTDITILPLEDGVYDLLLEIYKEFNKDYQVGAAPIQFRLSDQIIDYEKRNLRNPIKFIDIDKINELEFKEELLTQPIFNRNDLLKNPIIVNPTNLKRKTLNTNHKYPKLVGTLDKAKYVLNNDADKKGVLNDSNVKILERDFFADHIMRGILDPHRDFYMVLEIKYDGVSVEAEINNTVLNARQRGDANNDLAADVSPVLQGYKFHHADDIPNDNIFGMKFEAIMTYADLYRYNQLRGKEYKNCRTAISSIFNSLDGYRFRDLITLVPLETSLEVDRLTEIEFMNKYYHSGELLRYVVIHGNYKEVLFQIKKFVEEAEFLRESMPFMYDGVVVSYIEPDLIDALGRENSINKYSIAIKFNALKKLTRFRGYTYTVGQNGVITPKFQFDPVEFYGTIHTEATAHSLRRFLELELREGDIIEAEYVNDVMPYITKPMNSHNDNNPNPIIKFITHCPSCGNLLVVSQSGKSIVCNNIYCLERNNKRITSLMDKLNLKDFAETQLSKISVYKLSELLNLSVEDVWFLGEETSKKFIERMNEIKTTEMYDYKLIGALGFTDVAIEKWKLILNKYTVQELLNMDHDMLRQYLLDIKGIGPITVDTICEEMDFFKDDLITISNMQNIIPSKGTKLKSIRFTGVRDAELVKQLNEMGYDANGDAGVTKDTDILIVPKEGHTSPKTSKIRNGIIVPIEEFKQNMYKYL